MVLTTVVLQMRTLEQKMCDSKWYLAGGTELWRWLWEELFMCETSVPYTEMVQDGFGTARYSWWQYIWMRVSVSVLSLLVRRCGEHCQFCWYCFCSWFLFSSMGLVANSGGCSFWCGRRSASFAVVSAISFRDMPTCTGIQMSTILDGTAEIWFNMSCANECRFVWFLELSKGESR